MSISEKVLLCPECQNPLTGWKRKIAIRDEQRFGPRYEVEWLCESCDVEYVFTHGRGLILADEYERLIDEAGLGRSEDEDGKP